MSRLMRSLARSPIMMEAALVLELTRLGITEFADPQGLYAAHPQLRIDHAVLVGAHSARADRMVGGAALGPRVVLQSVSVFTSSPGKCSRLRYFENTGWRMMSRMSLTPSIDISRSQGSAM